MTPKTRSYLGGVLLGKQTLQHESKETLPVSMSNNRVISVAVPLEACPLLTACVLPFGRTVFNVGGEGGMGGEP